MYNNTGFKSIAFLKFGGSNLVDAGSFNKIKDRYQEIMRQDEHPIGIFSAFPGFTNLLEKLADKYPEFSLEERKKAADNRMQIIANKMSQQYIIPLYGLLYDPAKRAKLEYIYKEFIPKELEKLAFRLQFTNSKTEEEWRALIIGFGEEFTVTLIRYVLEEVYDFPLQYIPATKIIVTETPLKLSYVDQQVSLTETEKRLVPATHLLVNGRLPGIMEGFIAVNSLNQQTILMREGSDMSVAVFARVSIRIKLSVARVRYYKNVDGVFDSDPHAGGVVLTEGPMPLLNYDQFLVIIGKSVQPIVYADAVRVLAGDGGKDKPIPTEIASFQTGVVGTRIFI